MDELNTHLDILKELNNIFCKDHYPDLGYNDFFDKSIHKRFIEEFIIYCIVNGYLSKYDDSNTINEKLLILSSYTQMTFEDLFIFIYNTFDDYLIKYRTDGY